MIESNACFLQREFTLYFQKSVNVFIIRVLGKKAIETAAARHYVRAERSNFVAKGGQL